jgi:microcystin-dependent protein
MSDQCVGEIRMFAGNYAPQDWAFCDGSAKSISSYQQLFSLIGTTYGGDGVTTFNVPDLRGRLPVGVGVSTASQGSNYVLAQTGGQEAVTLTEAQMPAHTHQLNASTAPATTGNPAGNLLATSVNSSGDTYPDAWYLPVGKTAAATLVMAPTAVAPEGGSAPHTNIMPCSPLNFIIALIGIYPDFS